MSLCFFTVSGLVYPSHNVSQYIVSVHVSLTALFSLPIFLCMSMCHNLSTCHCQCISVSHCVSINVSLFVYVSLSICLLCLYVYVCLYVYSYLYVSFYVSSSIYLCLSMYLCLCVSVNKSLSMYLALSMYFRDQKSATLGRNSSLDGSPTLPKDLSRESSDATTPAVTQGSLRGKVSRVCQQPLSPSPTTPQFI